MSLNNEYTNHQRDNKICQFGGKIYLGIQKKIVAFQINTMQYKFRKSFFFSLKIFVLNIQYKTVLMTLNINLK